MKKLPYLLALLLATGIATSSCSPEAQVSPREQSTPVAATALSPGEDPPIAFPYVQPDTFGLVDPSGQPQNPLFAHEYGIIEITNDPQNFILMATLGEGWYFDQAQLFAGQPTSLPINWMGNMDLAAFPHQIQPMNYSPRIYQEIPIATLASHCNTFVFHANIYQVMPRTGNVNPNTFTEVWAKLYPTHNGYAAEACFTPCGTGNPLPLMASM